MGTGTYLFVRLLGVSRFGALISGIIFMFNGTVIGHLSHPIVVDAYAMVPWAFYFLERAIQKRSFFYSALTGVPLGIQVLSGYVAVMMYTLVALCFYWFLRLLSELKIIKFLSRWKRK